MMKGAVVVHLQQPLLNQLPVVPRSIAILALEFAACVAVDTKVVLTFTVRTSANKAANIVRTIFPDISHLSNLGRSKAWGPPKASL